MPGLSDGAKNLMLDAFAASAVRGSIHQGDPGPSGTAAELRGDKSQQQSYSRRPIGWAPANGAAVVNREDVTFNIPSGAKITHMGYWTETGEFMGSRPLVAPLDYPTSGTYTAHAGEIRESFAQ